MSNLGSLVIRRTEIVEKPGESGPFEHPSNAEVGDFGTHAISRHLEQDVLGLDVAVNYASGVHRLQAGQDLLDDAESLCAIELLSSFQILPQIAVRNQLHHESESLALDNEVLNPDDMRAFDREQRRTFLDEPTNNDRIFYELPAQDLDRDGMPIRQAAAPINVTGGAPTDEFVIDVSAA